MNGELEVGILECERLLCDGLEKGLAAAGLRVTCASGEPERFLAEVQVRRPALAIIDLFLDEPRTTPEPRGLGVLCAVREACPSVRAVVISLSSDVAHEEMSLSAGASAFLRRRETSIEVLADVLERVARGELIRPAPPLPLLLRRDDDSGPLGRLTPREREVLRYLSTGADNLKIAAYLQISERTVRAHVSALYRKIGAENRTELALHAHNLISPST